jgi:hypothetical protein
MYKTNFSGAPKKCPNRTCRAIFYRDSHKGFLPKNELEIFAVMRCHSCRDTFLVSQMLHMVHEYKMSLPEREVVKNKIEIFTKEDEEIFRRELYSDDNPLFNLYDGFYPGSTDNPQSDV